MLPALMAMAGPLMSGGAGGMGGKPPETSSASSTATSSANLTSGNWVVSQGGSGSNTLLIVGLIALAFLLFKK